MLQWRSLRALIRKHTSIFKKLTLELGVGDDSTHAKCDLLHYNLVERFNALITKF